MANLSRVLSLLTALFFLLPTAAKEGATSVVEVLKQDTFDEATKEGFWLVEFYAPWCGHCKLLNPILDEISEQVLADGMHIGKVDTTTNKKITDKFGVTGYPTLKFRLSPEDEWRTYDGGRKGKDLVAFAARMKGEPLPALASLEEAQALVERSNSSGVAFVFGGNDGGGREAWLQLAGTAARNVQHKSYCGVVKSGKTIAWPGVVESSSVGKEEQATTTALSSTGKPYLAAIEKGEAPRFFPGEIPVATADDGGGSSSAARQKIDTAFLEGWMKANDAKLFNSFGASNFRKLGKLGKKLVIAITDPSNATTIAYHQGLHAVARTLSSERASSMLPSDALAKASLVVDAQEATAQVEKVAAAKARGASWEGLGDMADGFIFGHLDGVKWKDFVEQFNVYGDLPRLVVMDMPKEVFYEDVAVDEQDEMETFLRQVHANKIPAQREGYQGTVKRFMAIINDMGWRFYAMMLPLVLSLIAFCISKPADEGLDEMRRRKMAKKSE